MVRSRAAVTLILLLGILLCIVGCSRSPRLIVVDAGRASGADLTVWLEQNPLPAGQNIKAVLLGQTPSLSYHVVQIRDREAPHIHATHDLSVTLVRGEGTLFVNQQPQPMHTGDVAVVPRGAPHFFVNTGSIPAAAFILFAPPSDGSDVVPAP